jgi:hypothetical protein
MNGRFQIQGGKNWILPKETNETGSSGTLIGWKSGQTTFVTLWDQMDGSWLWTQVNSDHHVGDSVGGPGGVPSCRESSSTEYTE